MVQRFGSREICDVTFKALNQMTVGNTTIQAGQPVFVIDTAQTSSMEQATTVVYAQGGRGYNRLIAWEGEKTVTFNVTDALMSPLGLMMLTDAGLIEAENKPIHVHVTYDAVVDKTSHKASIKFAELADELGIPKKVWDATANSNAGAWVDNTIKICQDSNIKIYATVLDSNGSIVDWVDASKISLGGTAVNDMITVDKDHDAEFTVTGYDGKTLKFDFYVVMTSGATEIRIEPNSFGGYFYVEADTLYRNEDGKDMAATLTFPKVKINSAFTITMAANGDPSTFDFQMDAMPAYTYFDKTKKVVCDIAIIGGETASEVDLKHTVNANNLTHQGE